MFWAQSQRGQLQFRTHRRPRNRISSTREGRTRLLAKPSSSAGVLGEPIFPSEDVDTDPLAVCRRPVRSNATTVDTFPFWQREGPSAWEQGHADGCERHEVMG